MHKLLKCVCIITTPKALTKENTYKQIRLILGDQLNIRHSWFKTPNPEILYVMMEIRPESEYVTHHIQKIVGIFLNMRTFAHDLHMMGHEVKYLRINDTDNLHSFVDNIMTLAKIHNITSAAYIEPDEYRLEKLLEETFKSLNMTFSKVSAEHYFATRDDLKQLLPGNTSVLMENFYHQMRRKHRVMMNGEKPVGGQWNFDKENRNKLPVGVTPPPPKMFRHQIADLLAEIHQAGLKHIGTIDPEAFPWPVGRMEGLEVLEYFINHLLIQFGTYQDAMSNESQSLFHSRLSFALNIKLISPVEVVRAVEKYWEANQNKISITQTEGFIRQIIGWREYMRGIYWKYMPEFESLNFFNHNRPLPSWFWTGKTGMTCLRIAIEQSLEHGYAHHIQRLMVTGNFCLLTGADPDAVDRWYLGIYLDAFQWVEITNTRGMSQYADGGIIGTKPYVSSASYIHRMSDHCKGCSYDHKKRTGKNACPFNSLYWRFLAMNEDKLGANQRMSMMYSVWHKMDKTTKNELIDQANYYLDYIEDL